MNSNKPASMDGSLINAVEPIPKEYRHAFISELREAELFHLAASFIAHWKLREDTDDKANGKE